MLTGEIRNQIDRFWDAFWSGGISNPLEVIEQITYLLFLKRLDELGCGRTQQMIDHETAGGIHQAEHGFGVPAGSNLGSFSLAVIFSSIAASCCNATNSSAPIPCA
jgi:HsdM N-terminal domain